MKERSPKKFAPLPQSLPIELSDSFDWLWHLEQESEYIPHERMPLSMSSSFAQFWWHLLHGATNEANVPRMGESGKKREGSNNPELRSFTPWNDSCCVTVAAPCQGAGWQQEEVEGMLIVFMLQKWKQNFYPANAVRVTHRTGSRPCKYDQSSPVVCSMSL